MSDFHEYDICATMLHHEYLSIQNEIYQIKRREIERHFKDTRFDQRTSVIRIPVVVHIIYHTPDQNVSQAQIDSQLLSLNEDFRSRNTDLLNAPDVFRNTAADCLIEFVLAKQDPEGNPSSGVTRTHTTFSEFPYNREDRLATQKLDRLIKQEQFGHKAWPRDSYLNIWVCQIEKSLLGYAQLPGGPESTDGVVCTTHAFGIGGSATPPFDKGRTIVHEVGHWLNLLHIWGGSNNTCGDSDNVADTPNQQNANRDKPSYPKISCNNHPHGDMFVNFMDYVDDDIMVLFTKGQAARMNAALSGPRAALSHSKGLFEPDQENMAKDMIERGMTAELGSEVGDSVITEFDGVEWV